MTKRQSREEKLVRLLKRHVLALESANKTMLILEQIPLFRGLAQANRTLLKETEEIIGETKS